MLNIVLYEPEIPQNTGNIVRTCAGTGAMLHLIEPLGFKFEDKYLKRAGLDYWQLADIKIYKDWADFLSKNSGQIFYASTKSAKIHTAVSYEEDCYIVFGPESRGLPESILRDNYESAVRLPMKEGIRSLNLSNAVAVLVYEYFRQHDFVGLLEEGHLTGK